MGQVGFKVLVFNGGELRFPARDILIEYDSTTKFVALIVESSKDSDVRVISPAIKY